MSFASLILLLILLLILVTKDTLTLGLLCTRLYIAAIRLLVSGYTDDLKPRRGLFLSSLACCL